MKFCEEHRSYESHSCAAIPPKAKSQQTTTTAPQKLGSAPGKILTCFEKDCKTTLNTVMTPATECVCGHLFCLKHRHPSDHACPGPAPKKSAFLSSPNTTITKEGLLTKLKEWSASRKAAEENGKGSVLKGLFRTKSNQPNSTVMQRSLAIGQLRKEAKGDTKIPENERIYINGEGPPNLNGSIQSAAQVLRKPVFFSKDWSNGKVLDRLADTLGVKNENNRTGDKDKKLQLFHIESGTLLEMNEKFGKLVKNGDTVVIARGW